jgi:hypothetical protein
MPLTVYLSASPLEVLNSCWSVFVVGYAMRRLVCLNIFVTFRINGLWYLKVMHFWGFFRMCCSV